MITETDPLPKLIFRLLPQLADLGDEISLRGNLAIRQYNRGALLLRLPDGVEYDLMLTNTGGGIVLAGKAHATMLTECTRCTEETVLKVNADVEGYFILNPRDAEIALEDDSAVVVGNDKKVDLAEPVLAALIFETPFVVLCKQDCAGICQKCYANLNNEECTCKDEPDLDHPFAALRGLFPESDTDSNNL
jgi:uncharacterized protein